MTEETSEPCLPCKITTVAALTAIGGYLINQGIRKKLKTYIVLGSATIGLGIMEIYNKDRERKHKHSKHHE